MDDGHNLHNCQSLYLKSTSGKCVLETLHCEPRGRHIQQSKVSAWKFLAVFFFFATDYEISLYNAGNIVCICVLTLGHIDSMRVAYSVTGTGLKCNLIPF